MYNIQVITFLAKRYKTIYVDTTVLDTRLFCQDCLLLVPNYSFNYNNTIRT